MFQKLSICKTARLIGMMLICFLLRNPAYAAPDGGADLQKQEFEALAAACAPDIHLETLKAVIRTESGYNPFAIGVVDGTLSRQPRSLEEALKVVNELEEKKYNYSIGLGQVNKSNFAAFEISVESLFEPCRNLQVSSTILKGCYELALVQNEHPQEALKMALSCYYSGNFKRGFLPAKSGVSYVHQVRGNVNKDAKQVPIVPALEPAAGGDEKSSLSSQEAAILLAPASTPTKLQKEDQPLSWVIIPEAAKGEQTDNTENKQSAKLKITQTERGDIQQTSPPDGVNKEVDFTSNSRLRPGEFVLILN